MTDNTDNIQNDVILFRQPKEFQKYLSKATALK